MGDDAPVRTALFEKHLEAGATMVDFHGFELPIRYSTIQEEHLGCRAAAGLFDVSHMGFLAFRGDGVKEWLSSVSTQDVTRFEAGSCGYTHFLDEGGRIIDDMIFAVDSEDLIYGVPNASMIPIVRDWLTTLLPTDGGVTITDLSKDTSILALQGPNAPTIIDNALGEGAYPGRFKCKELHKNSPGITGWIQGTGYTGERGVEIFVPNNQAPKLWDLLMEAGRSLGLVPVGLGARDTLRLEKGYLLSGQDFSWPGLNLGQAAGVPEGFLARTSLETNVPYGVNMGHDFVGKEAMIRNSDPDVGWAGLRCLGRGPSPRVGHEVHSSEEGGSIIGFVTSGAPSPSIGLGIGMAYLRGAEAGDTVYVQTSPRRRIPAEVTSPPFI